MATSLVSTGVQFPDSTIQTTAAGAGGSSLDAIASGSLSNGSTVVVNADGTVSVVATIAQTFGSPVVFDTNVAFTSAAYDSVNNRVVVAYRDDGNSNYGTAVVGTVSGTSISFGSPVVFESAFANSITSTYDSTNNKVVIAYADAGNSAYGTAIVGTVSGTSISFGTAVVFRSANTSPYSMTYDIVNNKLTIFYADGGNSFYGTAIVGTVSGTSISFGTAVVFNSAGVGGFVASTYDLTNTKTVVVYQNEGNARYGTARVGTVSGTSISFGSAVVFNTANTQYVSIGYDSANGKSVITYRDVGNSNFGTAIIGTVSGTNISFGAEAVFESAAINFNSLSYDSANNKIVIAYADEGNASYGTFIVGTVSGTSITFGSAVVFESAVSQYLSAVYDSVNQKVVVVYQDQGNSSSGTSVVFQNTSTNLTSENYIGISNAAYTNGQTATIQLVGSVDDAQTGLTAGQKYYVQTDGTLGLTPASPSVLAGTAQSATKLIIKR